MPGRRKVVGMDGCAGAKERGETVPARPRPCAADPDPAVPGCPIPPGGFCRGNGPRSHRAPQRSIAVCKDFPLIN